jgi:hypothetical protein
VLIEDVPDAGGQAATARIRSQSQPGASLGNQPQEQIGIICCLQPGREHPVIAREFAEPCQVVLGPPRQWLPGN